MIEFHAWEAKVQVIRTTLKLILFLLPIAAVFAIIPLLLVHHLSTTPAHAAHHSHNHIEHTHIEAAP
jgi:hypothetical protein